MSTVKSVIAQQALLYWSAWGKREEKRVTWRTRDRGKRETDTNLRGLREKPESTGITHKE
jgi:hypothetical protein